MEKFLSTDEEILEHFGWTEECQSPHEISTKDGSFASGEAVSYVIDALRSQYLEELYENYMAELDEVKVKYQLIKTIRKRFEEGTEPNGS